MSVECNKIKGFTVELPIKNNSLKYAFFEILAEYKRKGCQKSQIAKAMLSFGILFLIKEIPARKKRARIDGLKCIETAKNIGLEQTGGSLEFPNFSKRKI